MELWLDADTNLFFECKPLEQLPWGELGHDPVVLLLTKPVLDEIDKHKKGTGRTRARALEIFGLVRGMLGADKREVEIRQESPRVLLRLEATRPDVGLKDDLDFGKTDERLVGIVSTLHAEGGGRVVKLFTDDTGPASTASGLNVPFLMIDPGWRRPPAESSEARKIKDLEKDLATYRAQEPRISIGPCENADASNAIMVTRRVAEALTEAEIEEVIRSLVAKHPQRTDFTPPTPSSVTKASGEVIRTEYLPPSDEALAEYHDIQYPRWIDACWDILANLHEGRDVAEPPLIIRWPMNNTGTRPASQVRIEFLAKGPLRLSRIPHDEETVEVGDEAEATAPLAAIQRFPSPPKAPPFRENVIRTPPPPRPQPMTRTASLTASQIASDLLKPRHGSLARAIMEGERTSLLSQAQRFGLSHSAAEAADLLSRSTWMDPHGSVLGVAATPMAFPMPDFAGLSRGARRDPETFYWDWPEDEAVKSGALTCELWRHQTDLEMFEFEVSFEREGEARGTVECTVHAENLTRPEQARCIVGRVVEGFSVRDVADAMVAACG
jgi:hypothetical protein